MCKKILSVFIAVLMVASMATVAITSVSAAEPSFSGGTIYWECPWDVAKQAYCHVYGTTGEELYAWQTADEKMTKVEGNTWSYDIPAGPYDQVIFSIDTGVQTYDLVMTDANIGDTAVTEKDNKIENPMDSNKSASRTTWTKDKTYGPHLAITSIGNIVGETLAPTESPADFVATFIKNYYPTQPQYVTEEVLSAAMEKAGTTGADVVAVLETYSDFTQLEEVKPLLGVTDDAGSDNNDTNTDNNGDDNATAGNTNNTSNNSTGGTRNNNSTTSTTSSGTTTTGDSTPYVVLGIVLVAALGVAIIAAKKKAAE